MNDVDELRNQKKSRNIAYTSFLEDYSKSRNNICYGFVEGKDDPSYYRCLINKELPPSYKIQLYPAGNKENVKGIYMLINWKRFSKKRIVFFMDRDLSDFVSDPCVIKAPNVYITEKYSIENDIACSDALEAVLRDLMGFCTTMQELIDSIISLYEQQLIIFEKTMLPVMCHIILWRSKNVLSINLNNFKIRDFIKFHDGELLITKKKAQIISQLYRQCGVSPKICSRLEVRLQVQKVIHLEMLSIIIRGKYLIPFFICFCNSIYNDYQSLGINKTHTGHILSDGDMITVVAPRCRLPKSLEIFIKNTLGKYVEGT